jgi:hypothetical protein
VTVDERHLAAGDVRLARQGGRLGEDRPAAEAGPEGVDAQAVRQPGEATPAIQDTLRGVRAEPVEAAAVPAKAVAAPASATTRARNRGRIGD